MDHVVIHLSHIVLPNLCCLLAALNNIGCMDRENSRAAKQKNCSLFDKSAKLGTTFD